ncbi:MAG: hypothetical protein ACO26Z_00460 [Candidatus Nanopelagicaceae bacterium]
MSNVSRAPGIGISIFRERTPSRDWVADATTPMICTRFRGTFVDAAPLRSNCLLGSIFFSFRLLFATAI